MRHLEVDKVKEELVEVYEKWDRISVTVAKKLLMVEESIIKVKKIETDLDGVSRFLRKESKTLVENFYDSGISDVGDLSNNIKVQEEKIESINKSIAEVKDKFPRRSLSFGQLLSVLKESNCQLRCLKVLSEKKSIQPTITTLTNDHCSKDNKKRFCSKFMKYWKMITVLLCMVIMVSILVSPNCCEYSNSWYLLLPSITYTSGPRPF